MDITKNINYLVYRWFEDTAPKRKYAELLGGFTSMEDAQLFIFAYQMVHHTADDDLVIAEY